MKGESPHLAQKGVFLIACPEIEDGIFYRSVILLCDNSTAGSFGLIVNKMLDKEITEELIQVEGVDQMNIEFRSGGPMQPGQMMLLHGSGEIPQQTLEVCSGVYLGGDVEFLQKHAVSEDRGKMLLCFGFTGWTGGILEKEIRSGMWYTYPASKELLFSQESGTLWKTLLKKMGGRYASLAMIPEDLSQN